MYAIRSYYADVVIDKSEPFEDVIEREILAEKLPQMLSLLNAEERKLIMQIYYEKKSERDLSEYMKISNIAIHKRKHKILQKLKKYFEF